MKSSFYRPMMAFALALGVTACGGKAKFDIQGQVLGLQYGGLVLTDTVSGTKVEVKATDTTFKFPNSIEYGTPYNVQIFSETVGTTTVTHQPLHQSCTVLNGADTAGRLATINIGVSCALIPHNLTGSIKLTNGAGVAVTDSEVTGLTLTNGPLSIVAAKGQATYAFGGIPFDTSYALVIAQQPTPPTDTTKPKVTCVLDTKIVAVPPKQGMSADKLGFSALMTDEDAVVDVVCTVP